MALRHIRPLRQHTRLHRLPTCRANGRACKATLTGNSPAINKLAIWGKCGQSTILIINSCVRNHNMLIDFDWQNGRIDAIAGRCCLGSPNAGAIDAGCNTQQRHASSHCLSNHATVPSQPTVGWRRMDHRTCRLVGLNIDMNLTANVKSCLGMEKNVWCNLINKTFLNQHEGEENLLAIKSTTFGTLLRETEAFTVHSPEILISDGRWTMMNRRIEI